MSGAEQALATLRDYVERSTHWQEGGATRHDALKVALPELQDYVRDADIGITQWRDEALTNARHAEAARATARIAIDHLRAVLVVPSDPRYVAAFEDASNWLSSIGYER